MQALMLITSILFAFLCHCGGSSATSTVSPMMLPSDYNHSRFFKRHTSACSNTVTIKKGDICFDLAKQNGISVDQIKSLNPGVDCDILQIGSKFCVAGNVAEGGKGGGEGSSTPNSSSNPSSTTTGTFIAPPEPTSINSTTEVQNLDFALGQDAQRFCAQFPTLKQGDGNQNKEGQCSFTVQGAVPSFDQMTSTLIIHPDNGATVDNSKNVTVEIAIENLETGHFSDANLQYYAAPQQLNSNGVIIGHQHITVQTLTPGSKKPLDARKFDFFKGLNSPAVAGGTLSVEIPAGTLKNGHYRICSITGTDTHQPVIMPVAKRGSQDDCIRINVKNKKKNKKKSQGNEFHRMRV